MYAVCSSNIESTEQWLSLHLQTDRLYFYFSNLNDYLHIIAKVQGSFVPDPYRCAHIKVKKMVSQMNPYLLIVRRSCERREDEEGIRRKKEEEEEEE